MGGCRLRSSAVQLCFVFIIGFSVHYSVCLSSVKFNFYWCKLDCYLARKELHVVTRVVNFFNRVVRKPTMWFPIRFDTNRDG